MKVFFHSMIFMVLCAGAVYPKIVFYSERDGNKEIYTMNDDGSSLRRVTNNPAADIHSLWAPDGQTIAFMRGRYTPEGQQVSDLILMNADGSNERYLTNDDEAHLLPAPQFFTPDGRELAIRKWDPKALTIRLFLRDLEDGVTRPLRGVEDIAGSTLSPDGRLIAFEKTPGFEKNIHIVTLDGQGEKPLLPLEADPDVLLIRFSLGWAPDSKRLLFVEERLDIVEAKNENGFFTDFIVRENSLLIYHIALKTTERVPLPHGFRAAGSCWIKNNEILFSADAIGVITKRHGNYDIYRYHLTSGTLTQLTTHPAADMDPQWVAGTLDVLANTKRSTQWGKLKAEGKQSN
jgi:dipeptidyl aminopeptidase/acylaminoacyl peptidase